MTFNINDVVTLAIDLPDRNVARGAIGTVVHIFSRPTTAYEVEFCDEQGRTVAQLALRPEQLAAYHASTHAV